ncbi:CatB-related O-acetyltransferase [uncultured Tateyamaria sp.]|uniref:CatB-related O-acetyltransferase n=1 Tax=uncultured Tateyamaria sp. TaxID=455651 RepID=UPI0026237E73|nr:CatB-related O-acetyltransferase [uncultured Tateyamaria sp.]
MTFPDASRAYPITLPDGSEHPGTVFLNRVIDHPGWEVGNYSYASSFDAVTDWAAHLAPYLFGYGPEKLRIGRFCQIAHGVRFLTSGANHATNGISTFPFPVFDPEQIGSYQPDSRDTVIGHDVWIGYGAIICPGARVGNGVMIGAGAVVRGTIPDYAIVTGNPAQVVKQRFSDDEIATLNTLAWWDWPAQRVAAAVPALMSGDVNALSSC